MSRRCLAFVLITHFLVLVPAAAFGQARSEPQQQQEEQQEEDPVF